MLLSSPPTLKYASVRTPAFQHVSSLPHQPPSPAKAPRTSATHLRSLQAPEEHIPQSREATRDSNPSACHTISRTGIFQRGRGDLRRHTVRGEQAEAERWRRPRQSAELLVGVPQMAASERGNTAHLHRGLRWKHVIGPRRTMGLSWMTEYQQLPGEAAP